MAKAALKILCGVCLFCECVYLLLFTSLFPLLEGTNPDGSSSLTWRSGIVALLLFAGWQAFSFWSFRRRFALTIVAAFSASVMAWVCLFSSRLAFTWEPMNADRTFQTTWRSDLVLLAIVSASLSFSFLIRWAIRWWMRHRSARISASRGI
jgi:hypothetical protein